MDIIQVGNIPVPQALPPSGGTKAAVVVVPQETPTPRAVVDSVEVSRPVDPYPISNNVFALFKVDGRVYARIRNLETGEVTYSPKYEPNGANSSRFKQYV